MASKKQESGESKLSQMFPDKPDGRSSRSILWWEAVDPQVVLALISDVVGKDGAVLFGQTSDGGALKIMLMLGGERKSWYFTEGDDIAEAIDIIRSKFQE